MAGKKDAYPALNVYKFSWPGFLAVGFFSFFVNLGALASPIYMQQIFDRVMQSQHLETLGYLTLIVFFFLAVIAVLDAIRGSILAHISKWWDETVASDLFKALIQTARSNNVPPTSAVSDLMSIRQFVGGPGILPFFDGPWMPLFLLAITLIHPWLGIVAVTAATFLFLIAFVNDRVTRKRMFGMASHQSRAQTTIDVATRHADSVHSMGMVDGILKRYDEDNAFVRNSMHSVASVSAKLGAASKFIRFVAQISVLGLGAYLATRGEMTPGGMIAASVIMGRALSPAEQALGAWRGFVAAREAHGRLKTLFQHAPPFEHLTEQPEPKGFVDFRSASLVLPGQERPLLRGLDISFEPGQIVAIIGQSGSGKSTFCKMLIGALEPTAGSVRLDGVKIRNYPHEQFARSLGYLAQSVQLLDGTVKDNIARMGEAEDEKVIAAAKLAGCHELINNLPQGYDTKLGADGVNISGGQAQRIGFARAVYGEPALLVLDEPNANLDAEGDAAFQNAITKLRERGTAIVVVSHKPTALASVDRVITITEGTVAKQQTREEFLREAIRPVGEAIRKRQDLPPAKRSTNQPVVSNEQRRLPVAANQGQPKKITKEKLGSDSDTSKKSDGGWASALNIIEQASMSLREEASAVEKTDKSKKRKAAS